jgi:ABC-type dipeptide/oligopeptide/nickel transport system permease subunit
MTSMKSNPAKTVLTISVGFLIVYVSTKMKWALTVSLLVGLIGVLSGYLSEKIEFVWMKLTWVLSKIVPNLLLGFIFYVFLFPIAVISRLFGAKDPMQLKNSTDSVFRDHKKDFTKATFENPW